MKALTAKTDEGARTITVRVGLLLGLIGTALVSGCVIEPREGYWDRDHHRRWHEHAWVTCEPYEDEWHCAHRDE